MTRFTRIILMNDSNKGVREFTISHRMAVFLGLVVLLLASLFLWILFTFGGLVKRAADAPALKAELQAARADMKHLGPLQAELDELRGLQEKVLLMLGVEPLDPGGLTRALLDSAGGDLGGSQGSSLGQSINAGLENLIAGGDLRALAALILTTPPDTWPAAGHLTNVFSEGDIARGQRPHLGLDIAGPQGAPILAAGDGVVARTGQDPFLGIFVEIQHGLGYLTVYGHCRSVAVASGEQVRRGQIVAYMGSTGQATAPHLHFEIWRNGVAVDPQQYLSGEPTPP